MIVTLQTTFSINSITESRGFLILIFFILSLLLNKNLINYWTNNRTLFYPPIVDELFASNWPSSNQPERNMWMIFFIHLMFHFLIFAYSSIIIQATGLGFQIHTLVLCVTSACWLIHKRTFIAHLASAPFILRCFWYINNFCSSSFVVERSFEAPASTLKSSKVMTSGETELIRRLFSDKFFSYFSSCNNRKENRI